MCRFPFVKEWEWFNEMQTAKNGESKRETSEAYLGLKKQRERKMTRLSVISIHLHVSFYHCKNETNYSDL